MNNHYAKFEYKRMKTVGATDYTNQTPLGIWDGKKCPSSTPVKNEKILIKCAQNGRCTSSKCAGKNLMYQLSTVRHLSIFGFQSLINRVNVVSYFFLAQHVNRNMQEILLLKQYLMKRPIISGALFCHF